MFDNPACARARGAGVMRAVALHRERKVACRPPHPGRAGVWPPGSQAPLAGPTGWAGSCAVPPREAAHAVAATRPAAFAVSFPRRLPPNSPSSEFPSYRQAASLFPFVFFFFFKLGITTATIIMINSLVSKHFLKKSQ